MFPYAISCLILSGAFSLYASDDFDNPLGASVQVNFSAATLPRYQKPSWLTWEKLEEASKDKNSHVRQEVMREFAKAVAYTYKTDFLSFPTQREFITEVLKIAIPSQCKIKDDLRSLSETFKFFCREIKDNLKGGKTSLSNFPSTMPMHTYFKTLVELNVDLPKKKEAEVSLSSSKVLTCLKWKDLERIGRTSAHSEERKQFNQLFVTRAAEVFGKSIPETIDYHAFVVKELGVSIPQNKTFSSRKNPLAKSLSTIISTISTTPEDKKSSKYYTVREIRYTYFKTLESLEMQEKSVMPEEMSPPVKKGKRSRESPSSSLQPAAKKQKNSSSKIAKLPKNDGASPAALKEGGWEMLKELNALPPSCLKRKEFLHMISVARAKSYKRKTSIAIDYNKLLSQHLGVVIPARKSFADAFPFLGQAVEKLEKDINTALLNNKNTIDYGAKDPLSTYFKTIEEIEEEEKVLSQAESFIKEKEKKIKENSPASSSEGLTGSQRKISRPLKGLSWKDKEECTQLLSEVLTLLAEAESQELRALKELPLVLSPVESLEGYKEFVSSPSKFVLSSLLPTGQKKGDVEPEKAKNISPSTAFIPSDAVEKVMKEFNNNELPSNGLHFEGGDLLEEFPA